jgi:hypothetical protein
MPGRYPARCPTVFGLSSLEKYSTATARPACWQGFIILANVLNNYNLSLYSFYLITDLDRIAGDEDGIGNFPIFDGLKVELGWNQ